MTIAEMLLPEFDHEMANTRKVLERVPDGNKDWRPHIKSMSIWELALHLAIIPGWGVVTLTTDAFDVAISGDAFMAEAKKVATQQALLDLFDVNVALARTALLQTSNETFMQPWSLLFNGDAMFTLPRASVMRSFVISHNIHHRAQLEVYLRLLDIPLPSIYGPSADEG